ncbi:MAG TPA: hypothetical protein VMD51_15310 [Mycobacterium sp.]|nr:hypothetical protein [Mycobacterium sp.]
MGPLMAKLRRVLNYEVSIEALIEVAMWLAIPYLLIGLMWAFFHVEAVEQLHDQLNKVLPAGAEVASYVAAALLWPALLLLPPLCVG